MNGFAFGGAPEQGFPFGCYPIICSGFPTCGAACLDGGVCSASFQRGSQVSLTAQPQVGFAFAGWSGACQGTGACVVTMDTDRTVAASFTPLSLFTLTVRLGGSGSGTVRDASGAINCGGGGTACSATYFDGTSVTLTATPAQVR